VTGGRLAQPTQRSAATRRDDTASVAITSPSCSSRGARLRSPDRSHTRARARLGISSVAIQPKRDRRTARQLRPALDGASALTLDVAADDRLGLGMLEGEGAMGTRRPLAVIALVAARLGGE
jgi:hypothetical protein